MPSNKDEPKEIESEFVARASEELEDAVAEELEIEDPSVEEAEAVISELTVEIPLAEAVEEEEEEEEAEADEEEVADEDSPAVRHRGPQS